MSDQSWSAEGIDRVLELLPAILAEDFQVATWPKLEPREINGIIVHPMPYPEYQPILEKFWELCAETGYFLQPYELLPEDPEGLTPGMDTVGILATVCDIEAASLNQIRRYLVLCRRGERFCDGHIEGEFREGRFPAALRRLAVLREEMS